MCAGRRRRREHRAAIRPGRRVARKTVAGARITLTQFYFKMGALVPLHAHDGETMIYVLEGALRADVEGDALTIHEGEVLVVPAGAPHQVEALEDTFVVAIGEEG